jgi:hypothetical protein
MMKDSIQIPMNLRRPRWSDGLHRAERAATTFMEKCFALIRANLVNRVMLRLRWRYLASCGTLRLPTAAEDGGH